MPSDLFAEREDASERRQNHSPQIEDSPKEKRRKASINNEGKVEIWSHEFGQKITEANRYRYENAEGKILYHVIRFHPKDFRPLSPDGYMDLKGISRVPYRLPELISAKKNGDTIFVVEGEKDADLGVSHGLATTTFCGGAGK